MKAKAVGLLSLVLHVAVLSTFSLMQGCTTGDSSVHWLNWPYSTPKDQSAVLPADDATNSVIDSAVTIPSSSMGAKTYSVQQGDTLSSIASEHGTTWKKLAEYNNLSNPNQLKKGQELRIPEAGSSIPGSSVKSSSAVSSHPANTIKQGASYTIQKGDSLSSIAKRSGLTINEIKVANSLTSDKLSVGKSLTIPKKGAVKAPAVAKAAPAKAANPAVAPKAAAKAAAPAVAAPAPAPAPLADAGTPATTSAAPEAVAPATASASATTKATPAAAAAKAAGAAPVAAASAPVYEHVLYPGETLDDVARQYGSSQQEIMKLNNITDPSSVKPGTKLLVPIPE